MVKFNKHLKSRRISKWADKYINYKLLKQKLNEIYIQVRIKDNLQTTETFESHSFTFLNALEEEIRSLYHSYMTIEKDIFGKLNKILHTNKNDDLNESAILMQYQQIYLLSLDAHLYSDFVYTNLEGIRKIMKKFDKKFSNNDNSLMLQFINNLLDDPNSDFNYILQLKIVDETILLIKQTLNRLSQSLTKRLKIKRANMNQEDESEMKRLNDFERNSNIYFKEALTNLDQININGKYRMRYLNLGMFFHYEKNRSIEDINYFFVGNDSDFGYSLLNKDKEENVFLTKKFLSSSGFEKLKDENMKMISNENAQNIEFIINNTAIMNFIYGMNFGWVIKLCNDTYQVDQCYLGFAIAMIIIGKVIGKNCFRCILNTERHYKVCLQLSSLLIIISNFFLFNPHEVFTSSTMNDKQDNMVQPDFGPQIIQQNITNETNNISTYSTYFILLIFTRLILGFAVSGSVERKYLISFLPKNSLYFSIKKYNKFQLIGIIIGLLFGIVIPINIYMIILIIVSNVLHLIYISIIFHSPIDPKFSILNKELRIQHKADYKSNGKLHSNSVHSEERNVDLAEEDLTKEENQQVKQTNEILSEINKKNRYSDSNLVPSKLSEIINDYKRRKISLFMILMFIVSVSEFIITALQVIFPVLVICNNERYYKLTIVIPFLAFYPLDKVIKVFGRKKFLNQLLAIQYVMLLTMVCLSFVAIDLFSMFYLVIIPINLIVQKKIRKFIALTFEEDLNIKCIKANNMADLCISVSGIVGAVFPFVLKTYFKVSFSIDNDNEVIWFSLWFGSVAFGLVFLAHRLYKKNINYNRMKMISRIIKRKLD